MCSTKRLSPMLIYHQLSWGIQMHNQTSVGVCWGIDSRGYAVLENAFQRRYPWTCSVSVLSSKRRWTDSHDIHGIHECCTSFTCRSLDVSTNVKVQWSYDLPQFTDSSQPKHNFPWIPRLFLLLRDSNICDLCHLWKYSCAMRGKERIRGRDIIVGLLDLLSNQWSSHKW